MVGIMYSASRAAITIYNNFTSGIEITNDVIS